MSNPKLHWRFSFAGGPVLLTFANMPAEKGCEWWKRTARLLGAFLKSIEKRGDYQSDSGRDGSID
jgi:hypothetical protein